MVTFRCEHCTQRITVVDSDPGVVIGCPVCGETQTTPHDSICDAQGGALVPFRHHRSPAPVEREQAAWRSALLPELAVRLKDRLVSGLLQQRRQLIQTQTIGTEQLIAIEARMELLQRQHRQRLNEAKLAIEARDAQIRKLRRQKAALQRELEKYVSPADEARVEVRDAGLLLRT